ncbi:MAG: DNA repair protein RadA [Chloroflexi bacterium]|nr:DNA repair protein RadA [Chloroflexota bacterium]
MSQTSKRTIYICENCGNQSPKWLGRCPECKEWNSYVESKPVASHQAASISNVQELTSIVMESFPRIKLPFNEFNQVIGGGIVPGSMILIGGDPGIGKSTLLLQLVAAITNTKPVLYVSGEESAQQIKLRAERLGIEGKGLYLLAEVSLDSILDQIQNISPALVVIDSIQAVYLPDIDSSPGSITQVRECTSRLTHFAKSTNTPVVIIGHVTKEGSIAGPNTLEHMVDVVLYLEGERHGSYRILRSVKNRFGSTDEIGIFEMKEKGLFEVKNPSLAFISDAHSESIGSAIVPAMEGTRPLLAEIQALTNPTSFGLPRRTASGIDFNRLILIAAVLTKRAGIGLSNQDIIINVTGGLKISEPAADLAIAIAIASSFRDKHISRSNMVVIGEIGLSGEIRRVKQLERRITEAAKMGFKRCLIPQQDHTSTAKDIELIPVHTLTEAIKVALTTLP